MKVSLTVIKGPQLGKTHEFDRPSGFLIGRATDADFQLPEADPQVSRWHVFLEVCPPTCRLRDLGSLNKAHINGEPVAEAELKDGDVLRLGFTHFKVSISTDPPVMQHCDCIECGVRIEYLPGDAAPSRCVACVGKAALRDRRLLSEAQVVRCSGCGSDLSAKANSDGRVQDLAGAARYCCEKCLPVHDSSRQGSIEQYRILQLLGEGGMGAVFLVWDERTARIWALKRIKDLPNPDLRKRFLNREMKLHPTLVHPNVVRCVDTGMDAEGNPFIVTEYVSGGDLGRPLAAGLRLPPRMAVPLVLRVLDGVEYAHTHPEHIIHRDIKPENILLDGPLFLRDGAPAPVLPQAKIADFGLAKAYVEAGGTRLTKKGVAMGTLMYMSPQQIQSTRDVVANADLYSVGVVLYLAMTGHYTFDFPPPAEIARVIAEQVGEMRDPAVIGLLLAARRGGLRPEALIVLVSEPTPVLERDPAIPRKLAQVVDRAVMKDASKRFQTAAEFRAALQNAI